MTTYAALEFRFRVTCDHAGLQDHVAVVLEPLRTRGAPGPVATFELQVARPRPGPFELWLDGQLIVRASRPTRPFAHLLQQINRQATLATAPTATLLHTAAAVSDAGPILLPAPMESGKSTLVTALVRHGWHYLTDELVTIDPATGQLSGLRRAISLDPGSWPLFPDLAPRLDPTTKHLLPAQWQLPPAALGVVASDGIVPAAIVSHRYVPDAATRLTELDPVACLRQLISCGFSFEEHARRDLQVFARLIDTTPCYELQVGDLELARGRLDETFGILTQTPRR